MKPTLARLSKALRLPLTPKRGNKDYYKGKLYIYTAASMAFAHLLSEQARVRLRSLVCAQAHLENTPEVGEHNTG